MPNIINYIWRIIATGSLFAFFSIGALIIVYIILPLSGKNKTPGIIRKAFRLFVFGAEILGVAKIEFKNFDALQNDRGCLIVSNHPTLIDYVLIFSQLKQCDTIVKEELWNNFFFKKLVTLANYIPNKKFTDIIPFIQKSLKKENNVLIFPEGTRTTPGNPMKLKRGAAQLAIRLNVLIRTIKITCNPSTLTKKTKWHNIPEIKPHFTLIVGEIVDPEDFLRDTTEPSIAARRLTNYLQNILTNKI